LTFSLFENCHLCPHECGVNRFKEEGFCKSIVKYKHNTIYFKCNLIKPFIHEEPCITGNKGSCNVFFSACNLKCTYCQNYKISHLNSGKYISLEAFLEKIQYFIHDGFQYINFVSPTHLLPIVLYVIKHFRNFPNLHFVYNTNGYELAHNINLLNDERIIFLTDYKYSSNFLSIKYSKCNNYQDNIIKALKTMLLITGKPSYYNNGLLKKGTIVRHLVLPGEILNSIRIIFTLSNLFSELILFSLMSQYTPCGNIQNFSNLKRPVSREEYSLILSYLEKKDAFDGYTQELDSSSNKYIPDFF